MTRRGIFKRTLSFACIVICVFLVLPPAVSAVDSGMDVSVSMPQESVTIRCGFSRKIAISTMPACIEVGVDCGMPDMCGIDPCTCGSVDSWGVCSCSGLRTAVPDINARVEDENIVGISIENGMLRIRALGAGTTTVAVMTALPHYGDGFATISVTVLPFGAGLYLALALALAVVFAAALLAVRAVRRNRH